MYAYYMHSFDGCYAVLRSGMGCFIVPMPTSSYSLLIGVAVRKLPRACLVCPGRLPSARPDRAAPALPARQAFARIAAASVALPVPRAASFP